MLSTSTCPVNGVGQLGLMRLQDGIKVARCVCFLVFFRFSVPRWSDELIEGMS
jgi:hypothetical protein